MDDISRIKQLVITGGLRLIKEGLVERTWGNISVRIDDSHMLITPSGLPYEILSESEIVPVNYITDQYEGDVEPSSEKGLHMEIYKSREEINAVIHTHQPHASTVAAAHREVPPILDDMAQIIGPTIRVADYAPSSTTEISKNTVWALEGRNAALMANHGAVCIGRDLEEAFVVCQVLEKACRAFIEAEFLGGAKPINKMEAGRMREKYLEKYSVKAVKSKN